MSTIDEIIPPEIVGDDLAVLIKEIARTLPVSHILEIGSSSGGGSTQAFVEGISQNPKKASLYCMEISKTRFAALRDRYAQYPFVKCFNVSSVPSSQFLTPENVKGFYETHPTNLNKYPLDQVLGWLAQDLKYISDSGVDGAGIVEVKKSQAISFFDVVLIDGSGFTGEAELKEVYGSTLLILDDVNDIKNFSNYQRLKQSPDYKLIGENWQLRNGYAVFARK